MADKTATARKAAAVLLGAWGLDLFFPLGKAAFRVEKLVGKPIVLLFVKLLWVALRRTKLVIQNVMAVGGGTSKYWMPMKTRGFQKTTDVLSSRTFIG